MAKKKAEKKIKKVMREFEEGKLHSGSKKGPKVVNKDQALAIGYSEAKKVGKKKKKQQDIINYFHHIHHKLHNLKDDEDDDLPGNK